MSDSTGKAGDVAVRDVYKTGKDRDGDITSLCNDLATWSPVSRADAIRHIENGTHSYWSNGSASAQIVVRSRYGRKYLTTVADADAANNLDNLRDC